MHPEQDYLQQLHRIRCFTARYFQLLFSSRHSRRLACITGAFVLLTTFESRAQLSADSTLQLTRKWYDKETIYLRGGNSFVKNNVIYSGGKALRSEFMISPGGLELYLKSKRTRNIALLVSLAGSAGSIVSLVSGNRDNLRTFFWVSLGTGIVSSALTMQANNQRDQAVWLRNRDAMILMKAEK
ncbi:hypothetical protein [Dyadobacter flavalbus]|uniref:hypothetical protein n=1 Tax=Dyadobacter flavalbus TaxID=2579942 RepID=UPI001E41AE7D|nr:hypothetical protein [Dyadobacter flavalbus]